MLTALLIVSSSSVLSQSSENDSLYQLNLRLFINDYQYMDSAYSSALRELKLSDSALVIQAGEILDLKEINNRHTSTIAVLKQKVLDLSESGLPWYVFAGSGGLVFIIGILTGVLLK